MITFTQFLYERGFNRTNLSTEKLAALRKEHRKLYKRAWQQQADQQHSRMQIPLTHAQRKQLEQAAKAHGIKPTRFATQAIFAYLDQVFITPAGDQAVQQELRLGLKRIGVNANQIAYQVNKRGYPSFEEVRQLQRICGELDQLLVQAFTVPQNLQQLIREAIQQHPACKYSLLATIHETDDH